MIEILPQAIYTVEITSPAVSVVEITPAPSINVEVTSAFSTFADLAYVNAQLALKENVIVPGTTAQYWRGDKTWQTLDKSAVGLSNVDNTSDVNKPISTATQTALNAKEDTSNKSTTTTLGTSNTLYPTQNAVKTYVDTAASRFTAQFVFQPGGTASGNVYTSWSLLYSALSTTTGSKIIYFDDFFTSPCVIPAGSYNFTNTIFYASIYTGSRTSVQVSDGVDFTGLEEIENLSLEFQNSAEVQIFPGESSINFRNCLIKASGTKAPFNADASTLLVNLQENTIFQNNGSPVFEAVFSTTITFNAYSNCIIQSNTVKSRASSSILFNTVDPSAAISTTHTAITGPVTYTKKSESDKINYSPTTPANWITVPDNVKQGLDTLAASKEPTITAGTTSQYFTGDKTFQTLDKTAVGLSNVDNTSDIAKDRNTFEKVSKNLRSFPAAFAYSSGVLSTITYTTGPGTTIVKTFNYTTGALTSIVLSGTLPSELGGITTKTLSYSAGNLSAISYS